MTLEELEAELAALPPAAPPEPPDPDLRRRVLEAQINERNRLQQRRNELAALRSALHTQIVDVQAVAAECQAMLNTFPTSVNVRDQTSPAWPWYVSQLAIHSHLDVRTEALPARFPFFDKLRERGYVGPLGEEWNPAAALYASGKLALMENRLAELDHQFAEVESRLQT